MVVTVIESNMNRIQVNQSTADAASSCEWRTETERDLEIVHLNRTLE